jgi:AI-2 transport protein TqsA
MMAGETGGRQAPVPAGDLPAEPVTGRAGEDPPDEAMARIRERVAGALSRSGSDLVGYAAGFATTLLNSVGATLAMLTLTFFLALIMLVEAPRWQAKAGCIMSDERLQAFHRTTRVIAGSFRWYLIVRGFLGAVTGLLYVTWLWLFGVDLLVVWFMITLLLNFIPTIGSVISGVLAVVYALLVTDVRTAAFVAFGVLAIEQVMGNYVDPRMLGKQLSLSPIVTFVALLFWGWLWGVPGAVLAVPLTVLFVIVGAQVRPLRPLALLMSDETDMEALHKVATRT